MTVWTYSTVKLSLEAWTLIDKLSKERNCSTSEALDLLIRHGSIRLSEVERQFPLE